MKDFRQLKAMIDTDNERRRQLREEMKLKLKQAESPKED